MIVKQSVLDQRTCFAEADFTVFQIGLVNLRGEDRYLVGMTTPSDLIFPTTGERLQAFLYDISANGLGFTLNQPVEIGLRVAVRLTVAETGELLHLTGQVAHVTPTENNSWYVGCTLVGRLPTALLNYFLA